MLLPQPTAVPQAVICGARDPGLFLGQDPGTSPIFPTQRPQRISGDARSPGDVQGCWALCGEQDGTAPAPHGHGDQCHCPGAGRRRGRSRARRRPRRWQRSWRAGDGNPPSGPHYHLYLVKKLPSWMRLILIAPYRTGPLQTGQTGRRSPPSPHICTGSPGPGGRGHPSAPNPSARASFKRGFAAYSLRGLSDHYRGQHLIWASLVKK